MAWSLRGSMLQPATAVILLSLPTVLLAGCMMLFGREQGRGGGGTLSQQGPPR